MWIGRPDNRIQFNSEDTHFYLISRNEIYSLHARVWLDGCSLWIAVEACAQFSPPYLS